MTNTQPPTTLRAATVDDAEGLAPVHAAAFEDGWDATAFRGFLGRAGCLAFVAIDRRSGAVLGFILAHVAADEAEILSIAVRPSLRCGGLGRELLSALLQAATERGVVTLHLEVAADNTAALRLYEAAGFAVSGHRKGYYTRGNGRVDAVMMSRALG